MNGRFAVWVLVGWTIFLWLSRTRNVLGNDELTSAGRAVRMAVVAVFVLMAIAVIIGRRRSWFGTALSVLCMWTVGYWLVRGSGILIGDYTVGFKAVHTVLMAISIGLAGFVIWTRRGLGLGAGLTATRR